MVRFATEMRNVSNTTIHFWFVHFDDIRFSVVNAATGASLSEHRPAFVEAHSYRNNGTPLDPHTSDYKVMNLADLFDLEPGTYNVSVALDVHGTDLPGYLELRSNAISIRVLL